MTGTRYERGIGSPVPLFFVRCRSVVGKPGGPHRLLARRPQTADRTGRLVQGRPAFDGMDGLSVRAVGRLPKTGCRPAFRSARRRFRVPGERIALPEASAGKGTGGNAVRRLRFARIDPCGGMNSHRFCRLRPVCSAGPSGVFSVEGPRPTRRSAERSVVPIRGGFVRMDVAESGFRSSKAVRRPTTDPILCESVGPRRAFRCRRSIVLRRNRFLSAGRNSPPIRTFFRAGTTCRFVSLCGVAFHRSAERGICGLGSVFSNVPAGCRVGGAVAFPHRNRLPFPVCAGKGGLLPLHGKSRPAAPDSCLF